VKSAVVEDIPKPLPPTPFPVDQQLKSELIKLAQPLYQIQPPTTSQLPIAMLNLYSTELNASQQMVEYISQSNDQLHLHIRDTVKQNVLLFQQFQQQQMLMYQQQVQFNTMMTNLMKVKQQDMKVEAMKIHAQKEQMNTMHRTGVYLADQVDKFMLNRSINPNHARTGSNQPHGRFMDGVFVENSEHQQQQQQQHPTQTDGDENINIGVSYDELIALQQIDDLYYQTKTITQDRSMKRNHVQYDHKLNTGITTTQPININGNLLHPKTNPDAFLGSTAQNISAPPIPAQKGFFKSKDKKDAMFGRNALATNTPIGGVQSSVTGTRVNTVSAAAALYFPTGTTPVHPTTTTQQPQTGRASHTGHGSAFGGQQHHHGHLGLSGGGGGRGTIHHTDDLPAHTKKRSKFTDQTDSAFVSLNE
jgi:hypothetical protein